MLKLSVCIGSSCHLKGSYEIVQKFQKLIADNSLEDRIELKADVLHETVPERRFGRS